MGKRLTNKEFEKKIHDKCPELKLLSKYKNMRTPVRVLCPNYDKFGKQHGEFIIKDPSSFLYGKNNKNGCSNCANENRSEAKTKFKYNESFFTIPNLINSYWAGFIAADGCVESNRHISIKLSKKDIDHLKKFNSDIEHKGNVYKYSRKGSFGTDPKRQKYNGKEYESASICISNAQIPIRYLKENYNIHRNKSLTLTHPEGLSEENSIAFIKGYIDGDGYIERGDRTRIIICGTETTLNWIKKIFDDLVPSVSLNKLTAGVRKHSQSDKLYMYEVGHKRAEKILKILKELNTPQLDRKWSQSII